MVVVEVLVIGVMVLTWRAYAMMVVAALRVVMVAAVMVVTGAAWRADVTAAPDRVTLCIAGKN